MLGDGSGSYHCSAHDGKGNAHACPHRHTHAQACTYAQAHKYVGIHVCMNAHTYTYTRMLTYKHHCSRRTIATRRSQPLKPCKPRLMRCVGLCHEPRTTQSHQELGKQGGASQRPSWALSGCLMPMRKKEISFYLGHLWVWAACWKASPTLKAPSSSKPLWSTFTDMAEAVSS